MTKKKNRFTFLSEEMEEVYRNKIIGFFQDQRNEEIGVIAAQEILEFFIDLLGEDFYRKAVTDCKKVVEQKNEDIEVELDGLSP